MIQRHTAMPRHPRDFPCKQLWCETSACRLKLAPGQFLRVQISPGVAETASLVTPGGSIPLTECAAAILRLCDGTRTIPDILNRLVMNPAFPLEPNDARAFLRVACVLGWVVEC
jgi:hypothetical protein